MGDMSGEGFCRVVCHGLFIAVENMSDLSHDLVATFEHELVGFEESSTEAVGLQDSVHLHDLLVVFTSGGVNNLMELMNKSLMGDQLVHARHVQGGIHVGLEDALDVGKPSEHLVALHGANVAHKGLSKLFGVNVLLEEGEHLVEQLLLMQVVELQGGEHLVNNDVLVNESGELIHDGRDQVGVVLETNMNLGALNHLASTVHAHVELEMFSTDVHVLHDVMDIFVVSHHTVTFSLFLSSLDFSLGMIGTSLDSDVLFGRSLKSREGTLLILFN
jgi:hypothetical protein